MCRDNSSSVAKQIMKDGRYNTQMTKKVGQVIGKEVLVLCSDKIRSVQRQYERNDLISFNWEKVLEEARQHAPHLVQVLSSCLKTLNSKKKSTQIIALVISLLCNYRRRTMNVVQNIISFILYTGHCSKQVKYLLVRRLH